MSLKSKVLLTGATGFLGKEILRILNNSKDLEVTSLARKFASISFDLSDKIPVFKEGFELVIHCAGKAHSKSIQNAFHNEMFAINLNGTFNLIEGLEKAPFLPKKFVFISSVAVYGASEGQLITENQQLAATDSYGLSKILAEKILLAWCKSNNIKLTILRLPLVVGENPPGNLKEMIKAIKNNYYFNITNQPVYKSMVLAEDVSKIIVSASNIGGIYNLTDGENPSVSDLADKIAISLNKRRPLTFPSILIKILCYIGDNLFGFIPFSTMRYIKMKSSLTYDDSNARYHLSWSPRPVLENIQRLVN
jgi:nucleoside-diphosphate-sugar epimerase